MPTWSPYWTHIPTWNPYNAHLAPIYWLWNAGKDLAYFNRATARWFSICPLWENLLFPVSASPHPFPSTGCSTWALDCLIVGLINGREEPRQLVSKPCVDNVTYGVGYRMTILGCFMLYTICTVGWKCQPWGNYALITRDFDDVSYIIIAEIPLFSLG